MNERGFSLDRAGIDAALAVIDDECAELNQELVTLTNGEVTKATQREKMLSWLEDQGLQLENTQAATIDEVLERLDEDPTTLPPWVQVPSPEATRGLELMRTLGRSSMAPARAGGAVKAFSRKTSPRVGLRILRKPGR